jgi:hypothetical protein
LAYNNMSALRRNIACPSLGEIGAAGPTWGKRGGGQTDDIELVASNQADTGCTTRDFFLVLGV